MGHDTHTCPILPQVLQVELHHPLQRRPEHRLQSVPAQPQKEPHPSAGWVFFGLASQQLGIIAQGSQGKWIGEDASFSRI